jgi:hypothetical protein
MRFLIYESIAIDHAESLMKLNALAKGLAVDLA